MNQLIAERLLQRTGWTVVTVGDGDAAVVRAAAERYDLILMDCEMPGMDGYEATRCHPTRGGSRTPYADHRIDRDGDAGRSRTVPGRRDGRLRVEADRRDHPDGGAGPVVPTIHRRPRRERTREGIGVRADPGRRLACAAPSPTRSRQPSIVCR